MITLRMEQNIRPVLDTVSPGRGLAYIHIPFSQPPKQQNNEWCFEGHTVGVYILLRIMAFEPGLNVIPFVEVSTPTQSHLQRLALSVVNDVFPR